MEKRRARTPPNLLGIARKIAYAKRKYHSGWIWTGVTRGLAGKKLSGSISKNGFCKFKQINPNRIRQPLKRSLKEK
jgi:hypothetical protein